MALSRRRLFPSYHVLPLIGLRLGRHGRRRCTMLGARICVARWVLHFFDTALVV
jgi:hypothetical protein